MSLDIQKTDLYALLGVSEDATEKELVKAYRKSALKCHPDKNPDNPEAANEFQRLSKALEVLTDVAARAAYDKARKAKKAAEERHKVLDSKRKKFKEDLEARERGAQFEKGDDIRAQSNLEAEIERLRKQGSSLLEKEQELLKEQLRKETQESNLYTKSKHDCQTPEYTQVSVAPKLKISWKAAKDDDRNGGYSHGMMRSMFSKYGEVSALVISGNKNGKAIVEFKSPRSAALAFKNERGLKDNPLTLKWLAGKPEAPAYDQEMFKFSNSGDHYSFQSPQDAKGGMTFPAGSIKQNYASNTSHERDFESLVMMRMRQAEERKRLIEQMQKEDEES